MVSQELHIFFQPLFAEKGPHCELTLQISRRENQYKQEQFNLPIFRKIWKVEI